MGFRTSDFPGLMSISMVLKINEWGLKVHLTFIHAVYEQTVFRFRGTGLFGSYNPNVKLCILFNGDYSVKYNITQILGIPVVSNLV